MEEVTVTSKKRGRSKTLQGSGRVAEKEIIVVDNNSVVVDDVVQYKAGMTPEDKEYIVKCMQEIKNGLTPDPPKSEFFMPAALIILVAIIVLVSVVGIPSGKTGIPSGKTPSTSFVWIIFILILVMAFFFAPLWVLLIVLICMIPVFIIPQTY